MHQDIQPEHDLTLNISGKRYKLKKALCYLCTKMKALRFLILMNTWSYIKQLQLSVQ